MRKIHIVLLLSFLAFGLFSFAQKRKIQPKVKKPKVQMVEPTAAELLYQSMLGATAKVMFVDSMVVDKNDFLSRVPLNAESGSLIPYRSFFKTEKGENGSVYMNEFQNCIYYADGDSLTDNFIYTCDKLGKKWDTPRRLSEIGAEFKEQNYPFLMADGIMLLFAAKGENSLGGYDIFMTRKDAESGKFYQAENYGLPFNSTANDYLLAFDELDNLGWLVTDRFQPEGKVCIYTFVPTMQRVAFKEKEVSAQQLESYARLERIADTWKFGNRSQALNHIREKEQRAMRKTNSNRIYFPIDDQTVYTSVDDFKTNDGRLKYKQLSEMVRVLEETERMLETKRLLYHQGKRNEASAILALETKLEQLQTTRQALEKSIRNSEIKK